MKRRVVREAGTGIGGGRCGCVHELARGRGVVVRFLQVGGGVIARFRLIDDARSSHKASRVRIWHEVRGARHPVLVQGGVVGVQAILLRIVELHGIALDGRSASWKWVIH